MTRKSWENLALALLITFYILQMGLYLFNTNICQPLAFDYCAYWSAGKIINQNSFADIYNLDLLTQYQKDIYIQNNDSDSISFRPVEIPYLPIFVLPFKFLSMVGLSFSYVIWTLINFIGLICYLRYFTKKVSSHPLPIRLLLMILLSLPVFINFHEGQLNVWLCICAGEFLRAILTDKPYKAGAWLGGWLLKPQLLILIIPFLLIKRSMKVLSGFIIATVVTLTISFGLIKKAGFINLINILLKSAGGGVTSIPLAMMNWRMLGEHIASFSSPIIGWAIIIIGSVVTVTLSLTFFKKRILQNPTRYAIAILGIFAATGAVTWHAHLHMSMILIPPMVFLLLKNELNKKLFAVWIFMPSLIQIIGYTISAYIKIDNLPINISPILGFARGFTGFILNLFILCWAIVHYSRSNEGRPKGDNENLLTKPYLT